MSERNAKRGFGPFCVRVIGVISPVFRYGQLAENRRLADEALLCCSCFGGPMTVRIKRHLSSSLTYIGIV